SHDGRLGFDLFPLQEMDIALMPPAAVADDIVDLADFEELGLFLRGGDECADALYPLKISGLCQLPQCPVNGHARNSHLPDQRMLGRDLEIGGPASAFNILQDVGFDLYIEWLGRRKAALFGRQGDMRHVELPLRCLS